MNSTIFFMLAVMVPAVANAGLQPKQQPVGECTESPRKDSIDRYQTLMYRPNEQRPVYSMKLLSTPSADGKKSHLSATLSTSTSQYLLTSNPGQMVKMAGKEVWTKDFDAKANARGEFTASDDSSIKMTKSKKHPGEEYNDSAMVFNPELPGEATYETSVLYKEGPTWFALNMTCKVNEEQLAQVDGTQDQDHLGKSFDALNASIENANKKWKEANDTAQCKVVAPKFCALNVQKKAGTYTPAE